MSTVALDYVYRYSQPSALVVDGALERLFLATTSAPAAGSPLFFRGTLCQPRRTADLLLALARVVRTCFHVPPAMLARLIAESDPVVTCSEDRVRLEGFSSCCGVYARVDLLPPALDGALLAHGTTNVDFNAPMRAALAGIRERETVRLSVGAEEVELSRATGETVERKVPLPVRWLKGFVEAQAHQARLTRRFEVSGAETRRFLRGLPRSGTHGRPAYVAGSGSGLRLSQVAGRGAVRVAGVERLLVLDDLARHARRLRVYAGDDTEASGWELELDDARFHLVLSPEVWRGFSGEGQVLDELSAAEGERETARVRAALRWQSRLDAESLARECGLEPAAVRRALARLGASGVVGYDLAEGAFFHRELPYDYDRIEALHPRLRDARKLLAEGGVELTREDEAGVEAWVRGSGVEHRVRLDAHGARCTCPWWSKHGGERGPCKHVLAVQILAGGEA
ncbi:MAG: SWIM zinc finger domain-containing protein [Armatimonadota bacterium]